MYYFVSDTHFGHANIIEYCKRPFKSVDEMDKFMIKKWNERVNEEDTIFHLGDFCLSKSSEAPNAPKDAFLHYREKLHGNIIFLKGNHDGNNKQKSIVESIVIDFGGKRIYMTHNPKFAKEEFNLNFCGHVHEKWQFQKLEKKSTIVNLSVENWNYQPVTINEIFQALADWKRKHD